jgi:hypothetical protein
MQACTAAPQSAALGTAFNWHWEQSGRCVAAGGNDCEGLAMCGASVDVA